MVLRSVCSCAENSLVFEVPGSFSRNECSTATAPHLCLYSSLLKRFLGLKTSGWVEDTDSSGNGKLEIMKGKSTASKSLKYILYECSLKVSDCFC